MSGIKITGKFYPDGAYELIDSSAVNNTSTVTGSTLDDALENLATSVASESLETNKSWIDDTLGNDTTGTVGNMAKPFKTYAGVVSYMATHSIVPASSARYLAHLAPVGLNESPVLLPYLYLQGDMFESTLINNSTYLTLASSFASSNTEIGLENIRTIGAHGFNFDLYALGGSTVGAIINLKNYYSVGDCKFKGRTYAYGDSLDTLNLYDVHCANTGSMTFDTGTLNTDNCIFENGLAIAATVSTTTANIKNSTVKGMVISGTSSSIISNVYLTSSNVTGTITLSGTNCYLYADADSLSNCTLNFINDASEVDQVIRTTNINNVTFQYTQEVWVDGNRVDIYLEDGSIGKPYKSLYNLTVQMNEPADGLAIHIAPGVFTESHAITMFDVPTVIYGNGATITFTDGISFPNGNYARYDLNTIGNVVFSSTGTTGKILFQGGSLNGNIALNGNLADFKSISLLNSVITVNSPCQLLLLACTLTSRVTGSGIIIAEDCNWNTSNSNYLITSTTGGTCIVVNCLITNLGTGGGISCNNGANGTTRINIVANNFVATASAAPIACGTAVTIYSKNSVSSAVSGTGYIPVNSDIIGSGTVMAVGSDAAYDMYYRNASALLSRVGANTTTTKKFLAMTGNGTVGSAPVWDVPTISDLSLPFNGIAPVLFVERFGTDIAELHYVEGRSGATTGFILSNTDFPTSTPSNGDCYMVASGWTVTDNVSGHTNTGQTFTGPLQIAWNTSTSKWVSRDGYSQQTALCTVGAALYIAYARYYNTYAANVLDDSTYYIEEASEFNLNLQAPSATLVVYGTAYLKGYILNCNNIQFQAGVSDSGLTIASGQTGISTIFVNKAYAGTITNGMFQNNASGATLIINAGEIIGTSNLFQSITAYGTIYVTVNKMIGRILAATNGVVNVNTIDRTGINYIDSSNSTLFGGKVNFSADYKDLSDTFGQVGLFPPYFVKKFGTDKAELYYPLGYYGAATGFIYSATDFPTSGTPSNGDCYMIANGVAVTDSISGKTNTGQDFKGPLQIAWNSTISKWEPRDGLTPQTAVCSYGAAQYLAYVHSGSSATVYPPIKVLDNSTYYIATASGVDPHIYSSIDAPLASFVLTGNIVVVYSDLIWNAANVNVVSGSIITEAGATDVHFNFTNFYTENNVYLLQCWDGITSKIYLTVDNMYGISDGNTIITCTSDLHITAKHITGTIQPTGSGRVSIDIQDKNYIIKNQTYGSNSVRFINDNPYDATTSANFLYVHKFGVDKAELTWMTGTGTGFIAVAADFPATPTHGDCYAIAHGVTVTDNDATKTNTKQTFTGSCQIAWDGGTSTWNKRDGLTVNTCLCSISAANYIRWQEHGLPNMALVLDTATYYQPFNYYWYIDVYAPMANIICQGYSVVAEVHNFVFNTMQFDTGASDGGFIFEHTGHASVKCNRAYNNTGTQALFQNWTSGGYLSIDAGEMSSGSISTYVINARAGTQTYITAGKIMGVVQAGGAGCLVTVNTADDSYISKEMTTNGMIRFSNDDAISAGTALALSFAGSRQFCIDNTQILGVGSINDNQLCTLTTLPNTSVTSASKNVISYSSAPIFSCAFLYDTALGVTDIAAGIWALKVFASVNSVSGTATSALLFNVMRVREGGSWLATTTGTGTTRTLTVSGGSVSFFNNNDYNSDLSATSWVQTPSGFYPVSSYTSSSEVTITVPTGYVNETSVAIKKYQKITQLSTGNITSIIPKPITVNFSLAHLSVGDAAYKLGIIVFGYSTASSPITISYELSGTQTWGHIETPTMS